MTQAGETIGSYVVDRPLGEGGFAQVWLAHHNILHSKHAIKLLDPQWLTNERMRERFLAEGRILAQMRHPNLVPVTDVLVEFPARVGLVMEFVEGKPLSAHIEAGPLTLSRAASILQGLLAGVGYAHGRGIVHRDLKPANVIIVEEGGKVRPVVLDFGIAKVLDDPTIESGDDVRHKTRLAARLGTPEYMSPEQVASSTQVDARSDVWALGVLLHEMLTGQPPFVGATPDAIYTKILRDDYVAPPGAPPSIRAVLTRALARQASDRFPSCQAFSEALTAALEDLTAGTSRSTAAATMVLGNDRQTVVEPESPAPVPPPASMPPKEPQRERTTLSTGSSLVIGAVAGALLVGVLLCAGIGGLAWAWSNGLFTARAPARQGGEVTEQPATPTASPTHAPPPADQPPSTPPPVLVEPPPSPEPAPSPPTPAKPDPAPPKPTPPKPDPAPPKPDPAPPKPAPTPPKPDPPPPPPPKPPPGPSDSQIIKTVWDTYKQRLSSCTRTSGDNVSSTWKISVEVRKDGSVRTADASGSPFNKAVAECIETNLKTRAQFGALQADTKAILNVTLPPKPSTPQRP